MSGTAWNPLASFKAGARAGALLRGSWALRPPGCSPGSSQEVPPSPPWLVFLAKPNTAVLEGAPTQLPAQSFVPP